MRGLVSMPVSCIVGLGLLFHAACERELSDGSQAPCHPSIVSRQAASPEAGAHGAVYAVVYALSPGFS